DPRAAGERWIEHDELHGAVALDLLVDRGVPLAGVEVGAIRGGANDDVTEGGVVVRADERRHPAMVRRGRARLLPAKLRVVRELLLRERRRRGKLELDDAAGHGGVERQLLLGPPVADVREDDDAEVLRRQREHRRAEAHRAAVVPDHAGAGVHADADPEPIAAGRARADTYP